MSRLYTVNLHINLYAEYIMWNARLDEALAWIKIAGRNISNLRYADDTTLMAEGEELKSLLMNFPQFVVIHIVKGFSVVNKADVFLELSWFF